MNKENTNLIETNANSNKPLHFTAGKSVDAVYIKPELSEYENNPLILALPRIMNTEESIRRLAYLPELDESIRTQPVHIRRHKLSSGIRIFSPLNIHLDVERRISGMLRAGYIERNPLRHSYYKKIAAAINSMNCVSQYGDDEDEYRSTKYHGFSILGLSGVGKSQTIERILRLYPQVIRHSCFEGRKFTLNQLVWLKLDCPFDGSIKGLCLNFFQAVDLIFGTNYLRNYGSKKTTVDEMLPSMALVASLHSLGVLVIDEIQRLSLAKSGGAEKMLNFFTQLVNTVVVPVVMVGTYKALTLFSDNISQARRGTGQGDLIWDRMAFDDQWETFVDSLWHYQCTSRTVSEEQKKKLSKVLYEETQGITDLAFKAFLFAQERAIGRTERITPDIIRSVVKDKFNLLLPALEALRSGDKRALQFYEDLYPKFRGDYLAGISDVNGALKNQPEVSSRQTKNDNAAPAGEPVERSENSPEIAVQNDSRDESPGNVLEFAKKAKNKKQTKPGHNQESPAEQNVLGSILKQGEGEDSYGRLSASGFIKNSDEFAAGGIK